MADSACTLLTRHSATYRFGVVDGQKCCLGLPLVSGHALDCQLEKLVAPTNSRPSASTSILKTLLTRSFHFQKLTIAK